MQYWTLFISWTIRKQSVMIFTSKLCVFLLLYPVFCFIVSFVSVSNFRDFFASCPHSSMQNLVSIAVPFDITPYNSLRGTKVRVT